MASLFPKVLIINSQSIKAKNATGITLRSLWKDWPKENVLELVEEPIIDDDENFVLDSIVIPPKCTPLKKIMFGRLGKNFNQKLKKKADDRHSEGKTNIKKKIRQNFVYLADLSPVRIDIETKKKIVRFAPDVIYTLGGGVIPLKTSCQLAKEFNLPIVIHFMDNWPECLQESDLLISKFYLNSLKKMLRKCLAFSHIGIAISEEMALAYTKKFKLDFSVLMNSVDCPRMVPSEKRAHSIVNFVYAGGLHLDRWKALKDVATNLINRNAQLLIYTSEKDKCSYSSYFENLPVSFRNQVPHDRINEVFNSADVLVHAETNNPAMLGFFKYSISTKIPEYLSTGKNVLFYGPKAIGLYSYLSNHNVAFCASDEHELKACIQSLCDGCDMNKISNAYKLVLNKHDSRKAKEILQSTICTAINSFNRK